MAEKIEELNLPATIINRLIKDALPPGVGVKAEAKMCITRAASVFILYLTSTANSGRLNNKSKMISVKNIFDALEESEFESFVEPLKESLESFKVLVKSKKKKEESSKPEENESTETAAAALENTDVIEGLDDSNEAEK